MKKKNSKLSLRRLLNNNKIIFLFSFLAAFVIWAAVVINLSPEDTRVIEDVKVVVQTNTADDMGLQLFGYEDTYVDVTVTGKRYVISSGALSAEDISVVAKSSTYIDSAGKYTLDIIASPVGQNASFSIIKVSRNSETVSSVSVYYDTMKTEEFSVKPELTANNGIVPDGFISDTPVASLTTVSVSGPATEVNKIKGIAAYAVLQSPVTETAILEAEVAAQTENNSTLNYITFEEDTASCTVTVPVYMKKELPISVRYLNKPESFAATPAIVSITPAKITVAAAKSVIEEMDELLIGSIDFRKLSARKNVFKFKSADIEEIKTVDAPAEITVTVDFSSYSSVSYEIPAANISCLNIPEGYNVKASGSIIGVTVVGPAQTIEALTSSNVLAKIDFSSIDMKPGNMTVSADVYLNGFGSCWATGTYKASVIVSEK